VRVGVRIKGGGRFDEGMGLCGERETSGEVPRAGKKNLRISGGRSQLSTIIKRDPRMWKKKNWGNSGLHQSRSIDEN